MLGRAFQAFGVISDAYVARKKDARGNFFGFVSILNVTRVEEMLGEMNKVNILQARVTISVAKYDRKQSRVEPRVGNGRPKIWVPRQPVGGGNVHAGWKEFFDSVEVWNREEPVFGRIVKLRMVGMPLVLWEEENYRKIAELYGRTVDDGGLPGVGIGGKQHLFLEFGGRHSEVVADGDEDVLEDGEFHPPPHPEVGEKSDRGEETTRCDSPPDKIDGSSSCYSQELEDTIRVGVGLGIHLEGFENQVRLLIDGEGDQIISQ
ncbi:hypothetical protein L1987_16530 [Smallanthus sonchifolius]|uniref:Uncharacterized protein n=1 Tax=Smallanthus sonchifolius TaxID=185202 RepID=A0ACB9J954_9ASTR|nr:hypothetical protein L1987_16530 [Smallanthus sonchifolius]